MPRRWLGCLALLVAFVPLAGARVPRPESGVRLAVPSRPAGGPTGSEFLKRTRAMADVDRQRAAVAELERGNMPRSLRELWPVTLRSDSATGRPLVATIWVTPDYLAIGPDEDFVYMPLSLPSALDVAQRYDCVLPTRKMVDAIYRQARVRLTPQPLPAGPRMRSNEYYAWHQRLIEQQRAGISLDLLVSGHKKDLVLTNALFARPDRVAIYGWHEPDGHPIQPLSTVHGVRYADYSHGVRLVWHEVAIDGVRRSIYDVLADPVLAPVLSDEGALRDPRALMSVQRVAHVVYQPDPR